MTEVETSDEQANTPAWRQRAVSRSLNAARSRAEQRVQRFLDAAFELIDEKGTTEFTIQEVIDQSKQSLRGFYQYFDGKDELLLALFEETVREATDDLRIVVESTTGPLERLRAFTIRLHEWCDPSDKPRKRGTHNRRPIMEFSVQLAVDHPDQVKAAMAPVSQIMVELVNDAATAGAIEVADTRRAAVLMQQTVMYSWFGNRLAENPRMRVTAEATWDFCLHGLGAGPSR
jgi:AcrR family transcriptional regulator